MNSDNVAQGQKKKKLVQVFKGTSFELRVREGDGGRKSFMGATNERGKHKLVYRESARVDPLKIGKS